MLKLKSATEHYEETKENLQKMCETIDKISMTHHRLTENIGKFMVELGKMDLEGKRTREFIQSVSDETKRFFEAEAHRYGEAVEASLLKNRSEISDEFRKQTDIMLQHTEKLSKALKLVKYLALLGVSMGAAVIIAILLI